MTSKSHTRSMLRSVPVLLVLLGVVSALTVIARGEALAQSVPRISITIDDGMVYEGQPASFTLKASQAPSSNLTVNLSVSERLYTGGVAQSRLGNQTFTFPSGQTTAKYEAPTQDSPNISPTGGSSNSASVGRIYVTISSPPGQQPAYSVGKPKSAYGDLNPAEWTPIEVSISAGSAISEGGTAEFTLTADSAPVTLRTVSVRVDDSGDFAKSRQAGTRYVNFGKGSTSATLRVKTDDDSTDEPDGTIKATLTGGGSYDNRYNKGSSSSASVAVSDNDDAPTYTVTIEGPSASVVEGSNAVFTVTSSPAPPSNLTVKVAITQSGSFIAAGDVTTHDVVIAANTAMKSLTIATNNDSVHEPDGSVDATVNTHSSYTVGSTSTATIAVTDNDTPAVTVTGLSDVTEGAGAAFTLSASPTPHSSLTVTLGVSQSGSFVDGADTGDQSVTIPTSGSATHTVPTVDDSTDEAKGSVTATVKGGTGYTVGSPASATTAVNDDDDPPQPAVSFASASSSAAESAGTRNVRVNLSPAAPSGGLTVSYSVTGTATAGNGNDFTIQNSGTISVTASATTATIPVAINDDNTVESSETVILTLTNGTGYTRGNTTTHTLTITDNDNAPAQPAVSFASASSSAAESAGTRNVTVNLSPAAPSGGLTVSYSVAGTATAGNGNDFTIQNSGTISVTASATTATIPVAINDDNTVESSETVILTLTNGTGYTLGNTTTTHTLTITDNDNPQPSLSTVTITRQVSSVTEGTNAVFTVTANPAPAANLTVKVAVTQSGDYINTTNYVKTHNVVIAASATTNQLIIPTINDTKDEANGWVTASINTDSAYTRGSPSSVRININDNDVYTPPPPPPPAA